MRFVWDETDFLEYLEVIPTVNSSDCDCCPDYYTYELNQPPFWLNLSVTDPDGDIKISVRCDPQPNSIIEVSIYGCPGARVVNDKRGNYIEFAERDGGYGVRLIVRPHIRVEFVRE